MICHLSKDKGSGKPSLLQKLTLHTQSMDVDEGSDQRLDF